MNERQGDKAVGERRPRIRVAAIVCRDDRILLVQHLKDGRRTWLLPGGGVEFGESLTDALQRELLEETRLRIDVGELALVVESIAPDASRHVTHVCFLADAGDVEPALGSDERVVDVRFVGIDELRSLRFHPPVVDELMDGMSKGFKCGRYLGARWID